MPFYYLLFGLLYFSCISTSQAQCPPNTPGILSGNMMHILATDTTNLPVYTNSPTGLPNTEFIILQNDSLADDGFGPRIITSSLDGRVVPADLGLSTCNQLCVLPFSYDLQQLQIIVDSLLFASYIPGTSCCSAAGQLFPGLCDSLNTYGIQSGADVNNLNDIIVLMGVVAGTSTGSISVRNLVTTIGQLNNAVPLFGNCAGGVAEVCFAVSNTTAAMDCYTISLPNAATTVDIQMDTLRIAPNDSNQLLATYLPNTATDSIFWSTANQSTIQVTANGFVSSGATIDTVWVIAQAMRGCVTDSILVLVDPALSVVSTQTMPLYFQIKPNPFEDNLQVSFYAEGGTYLLQLIGMTGRVYDQQQLVLSEGAQKLNLSTAHLPKGCYFLQIMGQHKQSVQKVIKH